MGKTAAEQPDKKQIEQAIKSIKEACDKLKNCDKRLCDISNVVKELDQLAR